MSGPGEQHPWTKAWGEAVTPEQRAALWARVRALHLEHAARYVEKQRAHRDQVQQRRCEGCGAPLPSAIRRRCPACRLRRGES